MLIDRYTVMQKIGISTALAVFLPFILLPFLEMIRTSLSPIIHLFHALYEIWNAEFSFDAYRAIWHKMPRLGRYIVNSIFIWSAVTATTMVFVRPAAYACDRLDLPFKAMSLGAFLAVNMFTGAMLLIPLYRVMRTLNLLSTYWSMIIPGVAFLIPTGIWLLRGYLEKIPKELDEAAYVDGASRMCTLRRVVQPLAVPRLIVVGVSVFIGACVQQYLFAITFNQVQEPTSLRIHRLSDGGMKPDDGRRLDLHRDLSATIIYITHHQIEAMTMTMTMTMAHRFFAIFINQPNMNLVPATVPDITDSLTVALGGGDQMTLPLDTGNAKIGDRVGVGVRTENLLLGDGLSAKIRVRQRLGGVSITHGALPNGQRFCAVLPGDAMVPEGHTIGLPINPTDCHVFDAAGKVMRRRMAPALAA